MRFGSRFLNALHHAIQGTTAQLLTCNQTRVQRDWIGKINPRF
jgi:hypothetical protein